MAVITDGVERVKIMSQIITHIKCLIIMSNTIVLPEYLNVESQLKAEERKKRKTERITGEQNWP